MRTFIRPALSFVTGFLPLALCAQVPPIVLPQASPEASVEQTVGLTEITIHYHRPAVAKRKIWGGLVPYGEVWRAGANENTTITFTSPVSVEGQKLAAGTYGLHMRWKPPRRMTAPVSSTARALPSACRAARGPRKTDREPPPATIRNESRLPIPCRPATMTRRHRPDRAWGSGLPERKSCCPAGRAGAGHCSWHR